MSGPKRDLPITDSLEIKPKYLAGVTSTEQGIYTNHKTRQNNKTSQTQVLYFSDFWQILTKTKDFSSVYGWCREFNIVPISISALCSCVLKKCYSFVSSLDTILYVLSWRYDYR